MDPQIHPKSSLGMLFSKNLRTGSHMPKGGVYAFLTGILGGTGNIAFLASMSSGGKASIVVPWVGLAPLVTIIMARAVLKESITHVQIAGLALAFRTARSTVLRS